MMLVSGDIDSIIQLLGFLFSKQLSTAELSDGVSLQLFTSSLHFALFIVGVEILSGKKK